MLPGLATGLELGALSEEQPASDTNAVSPTIAAAWHTTEYLILILGPDFLIRYGRWKNMLTDRHQLQRRQQWRKHAKDTTAASKF